MHSVAFQIGPITVYWYGIMAAMAMGLGYAVAQHWAVKFGINGEKFDYLFMIYLPTIVIGARAAYVIATWSYYREHLGEIIRVDLGGLGSHGAIIAMLVVGYATARIFKVNFWDLADAIAPAVPLAHVFIRFGNFFNGELYGLPSSLPWAVVFPGAGEPRHPSMLYEGLAAIILFGLAIRWAATRVDKGEVFLKTMLAVSVVRVLVDFTRDRGTGVFAGLMLTQVLALAIAITCAVLLVMKRKAVLETKTVV